MFTLTVCTYDYSVYYIYKYLGTYMFTLTVCTYDGKKCLLFLRKNQKVIIFYNQCISGRPYLVFYLQNESINIEL